MANKMITRKANQCIPIHDSTNQVLPTVQCDQMGGLFLHNNMPRYIDY